MPKKTDQKANGEVISSPERAASEPKPSFAVVDNIIGSMTPAQKKPMPKSSKPSQKMVAVFSTKNVSWPGVGKLFKGYNIVSEPESEKWLTREHVRIATPEEVAREFEK